VVAFQSYLLFKKSNETNHKEKMTLFENKDFLPPNASIQDWDPFEDFQRMQKRMDSFFGKGVSGLDNSFPNLKSFSFGGTVSQNLDLKEQGNKYVVTLELPGLDQTKLDVSVEDNSLKISGNIEQKEETKNNQKFSQSYRSQHFERYLTLPGRVKPETLIVDYDKTELKIFLEKSSI
jgi:HSP20 family protein